MTQAHAVDRPHCIRWDYALWLSVSGLLYAAMTIFGWAHGYEYWVALVLIGGVGKLAALLAPRAPIQNAFAAGFLAAMLALVLQAVFMPVYFDNNPAYTAVEIPFGLSARQYTLLFAPPGGLLAATLAAASAWLVSRVLILLAQRRC